MVPATMLEQALDFPRQLRAGLDETGRRLRTPRIHGQRVTRFEQIERHRLPHRADADEPECRQAAHGLHARIGFTFGLLLQSRSICRRRWPSVA